MRAGVPGPPPSCLVKACGQGQESRRVSASTADVLEPQSLMLFNANTPKSLLQVCHLPHPGRQNPNLPLPEAS